MPGRKWTPAEVKYLEDNWGGCGADKIAKALDRSTHSVISMARARGLGAANRGRLTPFYIESEFGYGRERVLKACDHLKISLRRALVDAHVTGSRASRRRAYIPDERLEELLQFLAKWPDGERLFSTKGRKTSINMWGTGGKPPACKACGRADLPHRLRGWCVKCASREAMRERRARAKELTG